MGSENIKQKNIGDQINPFDLRKKYIEKIDLRLLEINKNRFFEILDDIKIDIVSDEKAHVDFTFSRFTKDDSLIGQYINLLIMTKHNGSWGIRGGSNCG